MLWWTKRGVVVVGDREVRENTGSTYTHTHTRIRTSLVSRTPNFQGIVFGREGGGEGGVRVSKFGSSDGTRPKRKNTQNTRISQRFPSKVRVCCNNAISLSLSLSLHHPCFCVRVTLSFFFFLYIQSTARRGERTRVEKGEKRYDCERTGKAKWTLSCPLGCEKQWPFSAGHQS